MATTQVYETERLMLKPTSIDDAAFVLAVMNTPKWIKNIGDRKVHSVEDAEQYICLLYTSDAADE